MMPPAFQEPRRRALENFLTGERFWLVPVDGAFEAQPETYEQIVAICNQPLVYNTLFARRLQGQPYPYEDGQHFLVWGREGWEQGTHFLYLICRDDGAVAGATDIKSSNLEAAEIGYWMSADHRGVITNAVRALARIAREAGYQELFARVTPDNQRSRNVLLRAGFVELGEIELDGQRFHKFVLQL